MNLSIDQLKPYIVADAGILDMQPKAGDKGLSVILLQQYLHDAGTFGAAASGLYGNDTQKALADFQTQYGLKGDGSVLDEKTAAYLVASTSMNQKKQDPVSFIGKESSATDIQSAQRLLRYFGYYRGRTDGVYSDALFGSILKYQQDQKLVGDATSPGAGRIGPMTRTKLVTDWRKRMTAQNAEKLITMKQIGDLLAKNGTFITGFLATGQSGKSVTQLQTLLVAGGYFPKDKVNGHYGDLTKAAVINYQMADGLIATEADKGAGTIGPITLRHIHNAQIKQTYSMVRASGWGSI
jgi:peptidoglycan hydrolase-like protein with peptidoglycan-binding domain